MARVQPATPRKAAGSRVLIAARVRYTSLRCHGMLASACMRLTGRTLPARARCQPGGRRALRADVEGLRPGCANEVASTGPCSRPSAMARGDQRPAGATAHDHVGAAPIGRVGLQPSIAERDVGGLATTSSQKLQAAFWKKPEPQSPSARCNQSRCTVRRRAARSCAVYQLAGRSGSSAGSPRVHLGQRTPICTAKLSIRRVLFMWPQKRPEREDDPLAHHRAAARRSKWTALMKQGTPTTA